MVSVCLFCAGSVNFFVHIRSCIIAHMFTLSSIRKPGCVHTKNRLAIKIRTWAENKHIFPLSVCMLINFAPDALAK